MKLLPGDIGFIMHHDNPISKAIAWFMGSKWSHSFLVKESAEQDTYLIETSDFHVTIGTLEAYLKDANVSMVIFSPDATEEQRLNMIAAAKPHIGTVYGYFQLLSFALRAILGWVGIKIGNFIRMGEVCTATPLRAMATLKQYPKTYNMDPESIHTEEFYQLLLEQGLAKVLEKKQGEVL